MYKYDPAIHQACIQALEVWLAARTEDEASRILKAISYDPEFVRQIAQRRRAIK